MGRVVLAPESGWAGRSDRPGIVPSVAEHRQSPAPLARSPWLSAAVPNPGTSPSPPPILACRLIVPAGRGLSEAETGRSIFLSFPAWTERFLHPPPDNLL